MAEGTVERLAAWSAELATPRLTEKYGYIAVRDAEIMGIAIAAAIATVTANPAEVLAILGAEYLMEKDGRLLSKDGFPVFYLPKDK